VGKDADFSANAELSAKSSSAVVVNDQPPGQGRDGRPRLLVFRSTGFIEL
jgi:hypothetical protein